METRRIPTRKGTSLSDAFIRPSQVIKKSSAVLFHYKYKLVNAKYNPPVLTSEDLGTF